MTWLNFLSYLGMGYALYYVTIFFLDSRGSPAKPDDRAQVLTFTEKLEPEKVGLEDFELAGVSGMATSGPASVGLGGVSLKDLFALARKDAIEFTKSVSF